MRSCCDGFGICWPGAGFSAADRRVLEATDSSPGVNSSEAELRDPRKTLKTIDGTYHSRSASTFQRFQPLLVFVSYLHNQLAG
jgi:hypothetical protein